MVSKKKSSNPIDAHRKAARARELKKNREKRKETREVILVKRDTRGLEKDIRALQEKRNATATEKEELIELQSELQRIRHAKEEYLAKNPEHRKFVYPREAEEQAEQAKRQQAVLEATQRRQPVRDPRRSIYYHEVFNPHGAPPPGMPFMEKSAEQWEEEQRQEFDRIAGAVQNSEMTSDEDSGEDSSEGDEEDDDDDDDIMLPEGPPPPPLPTQAEEAVEADKSEDESSEDEDGIVMPKGPAPAPPTGPKAMQMGLPTEPFAMKRQSLGATSHVRPPLPPPPSFQARPHYLPRPPPAQHNPRLPAHYPPPRPGFPSPNTNHFAATSVSHQAVSSAPGPPPARPPIVITSAPVLRDLKKEATAFVPTAIRKRQAAQKAKASKGGLPSAVNAAPNANLYSSAEGLDATEERDGEQDEALDEKVDLVKSLRPHFTSKVNADGNQDYKKFLDEVDDLL